MNEAPEDELYEIWHFPSFTDNDIVLSEALPKEESSDKAAEDLELTQLKETLHNKIQLFDALTTELNHTLSEVDKELAQKIVGLIQKITFKLIGKEIATKPQALLNMLEATLKQLEEYQQCHLFLSQENYQQLTEEERTTLKIPITISTELSNGDYYIKTETGEITALLEHRISAFLGL